MYYNMNWLMPAVTQVKTSGLEACGVGVGEDLRTRYVFTPGLPNVFGPQPKPCHPTPLMAGRGESLMARARVT